MEVRAGHFQFLDSATLVQRAVCEENPGVADAQVREVSQALMVAHAETVFRGVPREAALRRTMKTLEQSWGDGAFDRVNAQVAPGQSHPSSRGCSFGMESRQLKCNRCDVHLNAFKSLSWAARSPRAHQPSRRWSPDMFEDTPGK